MTADLPTPAPDPAATPVPPPSAAHGRALADRVASDAALAAQAARWVPLAAETPEGGRDAVTLIAGSAALVLLGLPGSGKTATLQAAWHRLARAGQSGRAVAPLYIDLAHARDGEGLTDLVVRALDALGVQAPGPDADRVAPTHLLLDNLDRMRHRYLLDDLRLMIDAGGRVGPAAVMACRTDDWAEIHTLLPGVAEARLLPIAPADVRDALIRFLPAASAEAATAWLAADPELADAVRAPRVLGAFLDVAAGQAPADWRRARVGDALLDRVLAAVPSAERALYRDALADVALSAHGRAFVSEVDTMAMRLGVTRYDMLRTGAVVPRGADLEFTEPLLARHCAALALVQRFGTAPEALAGQIQSIDDPAVAPLLVHAYDLTPDPARYLAALRRLPAAERVVAACLGLDEPAVDGPAVPADASAIAPPVDAVRSVETALPVEAMPPGDAQPSADDATATALRTAWQVTRSADVAYALAEVEADRGALAEAAQALGWAIAARPGVADWHDHLGQVEAERGRWIEAGDAFATALRLSDGDDGVTRRLARARIALGDAAGAVTTLTALVAAVPADAAAWSLLARAHEAIGDTAAALGAVTEALRLDDAWPDDALLLARVTCDADAARPGAADLAAALAALDGAEGRAPAAILAACRHRLAALARERRPSGPDAAPPSPMQPDVSPPSPTQTDGPPPSPTQTDGPTPTQTTPTRPTPTATMPSAAEPTATDVARIAAHFAAAGTSYAHPATAAPSDLPAVDEPDPAVVEPSSWDTLDIGPISSPATSPTPDPTDVRMPSPAPSPTPDLADAPSADLAASPTPDPAASPTPDPADAATPGPAPTHADTAAPTWPAVAAADPARDDSASLRPPMPAAPDEASAVTRTAALLSVAGLYQESGHAAAAYVVLRRAQDELPPSASLARRAGELALSLGDAASAVQHLSLAVGLDGEDVGAMRSLADAHTALGEPAAALGALQAAALRCPGDPDLWLEVARAAESADDSAAVDAALARAANAAPDRPDVHAAVAAAALARGDVEAARTAFERAASHDLTDPRHVLPLVDLCLDDAPDRALALLDRLPAQADVWTRRARLHARRGDWTAAAAALAAACDLPTGAGDLALVIQHADALVRAGRAADAAARLEAASPTLAPRAPAVDAVLGAAYAAVGRDRDALVAWSAAAAGNALDAPTLVAYSRLACRLGALDEAVRAAEAAVLLDGTLAEAAAAQADALESAGRLEAAAHAAQAALALGPEAADGYARLARLATALGRSDLAVATLQSGVGCLPESAALHHDLGRALAMRHDERGARASYARAAALAPQSPLYQRDLADSLATEDPTGALDALERAVAAAPEDPEAFRAKAALEHAAGDMTAERASLERAVVLAPDRPDLFLALARACLAAGDTAAAARAIASAHALAPHDAGVHTMRGALHEATDQLPAALDDYETAARLAPASAAAWSAVGRLRLARHDVAGALTALAEAARLDDTDPRTHRALAEALERVDQPADAVAHWAIAHRLAPDDPDIRLGLGRARLNAGDAHGAVAVLRHALPAEGGDGTGSPTGDATRHAVLAEALLATGRLEDAQTNAAQAIELDPSSATAWRAQAAVRRAAGDLAGARAGLAEAARLAPSAAAYRAVAELDDARGDSTAAAASWRHVLERDPEHAVAALHYGRRVAQAGWQLELAAPTPAPAIDGDVAAFAEMVLVRARPRLEGPGAAAAERALAIVRGRAGHIGGMLEAAQAAVALQPDAENLLARAWAQLAAGDPTAALADLRLATARGTDDARRHALAASAHEALGEPAAAAEALLEAIERAPTIAELPCRLAEIQLAGGDRSAAAGTLRLAASLATDAATERRLASLALDAGAPEVACGVLEARASAEPNDPALLSLLAEARRRLGDMPGAQDALLQAARYGPERAETQAQLGDLLAELGDLDGARARYGKAIALQPYQPAWRLADAAALLALGRTGEARAVLVDALTFAPSSVEVRLRLASLWLEDKDAKAARDVLEPARIAAPDDARIHHQIGLAARALGDHEAAAAALDTAAQLNPTDPRPFVALGDLHRTQGEVDDAIQAYEQAVAIAPRAVEVYLRLAGACREAGMVERALLIHEQAVDLAPDDAAPRLAFGRVLAELGHFARAVEVLDPTLGLMVEGDGRLAETLTLIANLYARLDQHERARPYLEQAHALQPSEQAGKRLRANHIVQLFARSRARHANGAPRDPGS